MRSRNVADADVSYVWLIGLLSCCYSTDIGASFEGEINRLRSWGYTEEGWGRSSGALNNVQGREGGRRGRL